VANNKVWFEFVEYIWQKQGKNIIMYGLFC